MGCNLASLVCSCSLLHWFFQGSNIAIQTSAEFQSKSISRHALVVIRTHVEVVSFVQFAYLTMSQNQSGGEEEPEPEPEPEREYTPAGRALKMKL